MQPTETELLHRGGPAMAWGNFGLWPAPDYASASAALADVTAHAARLQQGDCVASPGCGAGEELRRWIDVYGASQAVGVDTGDATSPPLTLPAGARRLQVAAGDGMDQLTAEFRHRFDAVVCVDAAYHFSPRQGWLQRARQLLRSGGRLAFTDLTLRQRWLPLNSSRRLLGPAAVAAQIDLHDVLTLDGACRRLQDAGFLEIQATPLDTAVLDGFVAFVRQQARTLGSESRAPGWRRVSRTASLLRLARPLGLGYSLFSARAPTF